MPEQSAWQTAREPTTISSSASAIAKLPLIEPFEPPTCMFCACPSGSTPVELGDSPTAAPATCASCPTDATIEGHFAGCVDRVRRLLDRHIISGPALRQGR